MDFKEGIVELKSNDSKNSVKIALFGATVISWICNGKERLFLASKVKSINGPSAIRGGIPIVFPQFGPVGPLKQHGFARLTVWKVISQSDLSVTLSLNQNDISTEMRKLWPFDFELLYTISLHANGNLETAISIENTSDAQPLEFNWLFHTYFLVPDARNIQIYGMKGLDFIDSVTKQQMKASSEKPEEPMVGGVGREVDLIVPKVTEKHVGIEGVVDIKKEDCISDVVLWNPWIERSKQLTEFDADKHEYLHMFCLETGLVSRKQGLKAREKWSAKQVFSSKF